MSEQSEKSHLSVEPGRPISYWLGWVGFGLMIVLLTYSIRKRLFPDRNFGELSGWLDFHIFCGLLGPILIIYQL